MNDRAMMCAGAIGAVIAAICCATPALAILLSMVGLGAWLATADYLVIPLFLLSLGLVAIGLYRRRATGHARREAKPVEKGAKS